MQSKHSAHAGIDTQLRQSELDILVDCIRNEIGTVFRRGPTAGRIEGASTGLASIAVNDVTRNPSLYSVFHETKVYDGFVLPVVAIEPF